MFELKFSHGFKKDYKRYKHQRNIITELEKILNILVADQKLPMSNLNHKLSGKRKNCLECHIKPNVLLMYERDTQESTITLVRMGSHSEIF